MYCKHYKMSRVHQFGFVDFCLQEIDYFLIKSTFVSFDTLQSGTKLIFLSRHVQNCYKLHCGHWGKEFMPCSNRTHLITHYTNSRMRLRHIRLRRVSKKNSSTKPNLEPHRKTIIVCQPVSTNKTANA